MATGTRTTDTFAEGLRKLLSSITDLKMTDDADMPFIINMETMILQRLKSGASAALQPGGGVPGAGPIGGPPAGPGMGPAPGLGMPMGGPGISPAPVPGLMAGPNLPNPDELRRVLTSGTPASRYGGRLAGL